MTEYGQLRYLPATGANYSKGVHHGLKLLILGESHYGDETHGADETRYWLGRHIAGEVSRTWRACEEVLQYAVPDLNPPSAIWDRVAFANFVQISMPNRQARPDEVGWRTGKQSFPDLLEFAKPDVLLALGLETWRQLPWDHWPWGQPENHKMLRTMNDQWGVVYPRKDGALTVAGFIYHPASHGWRAPTWYPHVMRLLIAAEEVLHQT